MKTVTGIHAIILLHNSASAAQSLLCAASMISGEIKSASLETAWRLQVNVRGATSAAQEGNLDWLPVCFAPRPMYCLRSEHPLI